MTDPRLVFLGNDRWSVPPLEALHHLGPRPVLTITRAPRPAGRGSKLRPTAVAAYARDEGLPLAEVDTVRSGAGLRALRDARPDVIAVVAYGEILPTEILELPRLGCVNLHFSLLPRWRGASPVQRAILAGDPATGVSVIVMDEGLDTGPVLDRVRETVGPEDDTGALGGRLATAGAPALRSSILGHAAGELIPAPQPDEGVTYAPKLTAEERWIDWNEDANAVGRRVRALAPDTRASTRLRGSTVKVIRGRPLSAPGSDAPGLIVSADPSGVAVATGRGSYLLEEVAPEGRRRMPAGAWALGARFRPGERLG